MSDQRCKCCGLAMRAGYRSATFAGHKFCRTACVDEWARGEAVRLRGWLSMILLVCRGLAKSYAGIALYSDKAASRTGGG